MSGIYSSLATLRWSPASSTVALAQLKQRGSSFLAPQYSSPSNNVRGMVRVGQSKYFESTLYGGKQKLFSKKVLLKKITRKDATVMSFVNPDCDYNILLNSILTNVTCLHTCIFIVNCSCLEKTIYLLAEFVSVFYIIIMQFWKGIIASVNLDGWYKLIQNENTV